MAKIFSFPSSTVSALNAELNKKLIKQRKVSGKDLSYISGSTVTMILNQAFNYNWDWTITEQWIQESKDKKTKDSEGKTFYETQAPVVHVKGALTVRFLEEDGTTVSIKKEAFGSKVIVGGASEQESVFKAAATDAYKKAASLLGVGLQLYVEDEEFKALEDLICSIKEESAYKEMWTEENMEKSGHFMEDIDKLLIEHGANDDDVQQLLSQWSDGKIENLFGLSPNNIESFYNFLVELLEQEAV